MPLQPGSSRRVISQNISEFKKGETYRQTAAKHGTETANRQAVAVAMSEARKGKVGVRKKKRVGVGK